MPSESRIVKWAVELHWNKRDFICRRTKEFQLRGQGEEARSLGIKASHKLENHSIFAQNRRSVSVFLKYLSNELWRSQFHCEILSYVFSFTNSIVFVFVLLLQRREEKCCSSYSLLSRTIISEAIIQIFVERLVTIINFLILSPYFSLISKWD